MGEGHDWGKEAGSLRDVAPSRVDDDEFGRWWATLMRLGASPRAVLLLGEMAMAVDVRELLPRVSVPTLVMHRAGDRVNGSPMVGTSPKGSRERDGLSCPVRTSRSGRAT